MWDLNITIVGIISVSLDVEILNIFVSHVIWLRLHPDFNTLAFGIIRLAYGGWARSTSASQNLAVLAVLPKRHDNSLFRRR